MGYFITELKNTKLNEYIGSQTLYSCADNGAFDSEIDKELQNYFNENNNIFVIVDKNGINRFLTILKSGKCCGRDIEKFIKIVEEKYVNGFMVLG